MRFIVTGQNIGKNSVNYGKWVYFVDTPTETEAAAEAVRVIKATCGAVAAACTVLSVTKGS